MPLPLQTMDEETNEIMSIKHIALCLKPTSCLIEDLCFPFISYVLRILFTESKHFSMQSQTTVCSNKKPEYSNSNIKGHKSEHTTPLLQIPILIHRVKSYFPNRTYDIFHNNVVHLYHFNITFPSLLLLTPTPTLTLLQLS